jgi:acetylornithine/N-succinyldiaminopimelate aminotransferase
MTWQQRWTGAMMNNYGTPPLLLTRGKGSRVWDENGNEYVDLIAGIAVNALGHGDPRVTEAITDQLNTLGHVSNLYASEPGIELAEKLIELTGQSSARVFFCNSGAEANEAAFKMTRLTGRTKVIVAEGSFHGRTMGSLALTAQPGKADPFRPLPGDVVTVPYGDTAALASGSRFRDRRGLPRADPRRGWRDRSAGWLPSSSADRPPPQLARCSSSMKCRRESGAPAPGSHTKATRPR